MYMYVLLLLQVFKSSCNCRKLLYCSRLSKLFNADNQTAIAARPCTVGVSFYYVVITIIIIIYIYLFPLGVSLVLISYALNLK